MANQVILKKSSVAARVPVAGDLAYGELALNYADGILYFKKPDNTISSISTSSGGGTTTNALTIGSGLSGTSFNGSSAVTIAIDSSVVTLTGTQTLSNKTFTAPVLGIPASGDFSTGTFTWPTFNQNTTGTAAGLSSILAVASGGTGTATPGIVAGTNVTVSGTWPNQTVAASAANATTANALTIGTGLTGTSFNGSTATTVAIDSTVVTLLGTQSLSNKTLVSPVISTIVNTGTLSLPTTTDTLVGRDTTDTLTNKTIVSRLVTIADGSSITVNTDTTDTASQLNTQAAGTLTINAPTGTPINGQKLILKIKSTNTQTFSWNAVFTGSVDQTLPTTTSGANKYDYLGFIYNSDATKWQLVAKNFGF